MPYTVSQRASAFGIQRFVPRNCIPAREAASAATAQIEATAGLSIRISVNEKDQPDYGKVQAIIIMASASCALVLFSIIGPEKHSTDFENENTVIEEAAPPEIKAGMAMNRVLAGDSESADDDNGDFEHV